ncbi:hypothetical protein TNCV_1448841 [Trichonephila clavipes]|nr:hypothetical protein TNCV_1448841 [Trichonephila clavipes]
MGKSFLGDRYGQIIPLATPNLCYTSLIVVAERRDGPVSQQSMARCFWLVQVLQNTQSRVILDTPLCRGRSEYEGTVISLKRRRGALPVSSLVVVCTIVAECLYAAVPKEATIMVTVQTNFAARNVVKTSVFIFTMLQTRPLPDSCHVMWLHEPTLPA